MVIKLLDVMLWVSFFWIGLVGAHLMSGNVHLVSAPYLGRGRLIRCLYAGLSIFCMVGVFSAVLR